MKLTPIQIAFAAMGTFIGIITLNVLSRYRSDESFRDQWSKVPTEHLSAFKNKLVSQENMVSIPVPTADNSQEGDNDGDEGEVN